MFAIFGRDFGNLFSPVEKTIQSSSNSAIKQFQNNWSLDSIDEEATNVMVAFIVSLDL